MILTIKEANNLIHKGELTASELLKLSIEQIKNHDKKLHVFLKLDLENAKMAALAADQRIKKNKRLSLLDGIPISIKDVLVTKDLETTAGAKILEGFVPPYDATVVKLLKDAGAVILGKTNCDAWAHGSSTENSDYGPTKNPWDPTRVPGGSSGGSAAAVASGMGLASIGTDTGGSIRQPAALCGVVGLKPTYGRVSRYGLIAMASSLDCPGTFTRSVEDAILLLHTISGHDELDSTSLPQVKFPIINLEHSSKSLKGIKIGLYKDYFAQGLNQGVSSAIQNAIKVFTESGAEIIDVELPLSKYALAVYYIIQPAEVSSNLARYDGIRYGLSKIKNNAHELIVANRSQGLGVEAKRRIMMGTHVLSSGYYDAYYKRAMQVRTKVIEEFHHVFDKVDLLLTPTTTDVAFKFGTKKDPLSMYLEDIYTVSANIAGLPAISIPCGFVDKLPVGLQLIGPQLGEEIILRSAMAYQKETDWHLKMPEF